VAVSFASAKHPAPNALFERMAQAMERHVGKSTINGQSVYRRCLGNVNDVFRSIGGSPRYLSPTYDQARDVANALRGKANRTDPAPRGAICLWTSGASADGHIAVADGNGNSVNNWDSGIVKRVPLAQQRSGYVGWVSPQLLGSGISNGTNNANPDYEIGAGGDDKVYPLPAPQRRQPDSGLAMPFLGSGDLSLIGKDLTASVAQLIDSVRLDASEGTVAQLTLVSHDPDLALSKSVLADIGTTVRWQFGGLTSLWDISTVDVSAADALVTIAARSTLAKRLRRRVKVRSARDVSPSQWVRRVVEGAGGNAVVQKSNRKGEIAQGDGVTEWDMITSLADDLGWSWVEYGGVVLFGSRHWAWSGGPKRPLWMVTWGDSPRTDALDINVSQTSDDPDNVAVGSVVLPWNRGMMLQPWDCLEVSGLGRWDGVYLVESVTATTDGISAVEVQVAMPQAPAPDRGTKSTSSATRNDTPPTRDKTSVKYAKWFARQEMAKGKYGWGSDDQWAALEQLWTRESGWNYKAENPSSGAYGIPQSLPGSKMAAAGKDWRTNPETQIRWGLDYIKGRYGGPKRAWAHFQQRNWY
jgi:hypothetical protein